METGEKIRTNKRKSSEKPISPKTVGKSIHTLVDGSFLARDTFFRLIPFLLFLLLLAIIYISNIYYAEKTIRNIEDARTELKELRYEFITSKSDLMGKSKRSEVAKSLEEEGIIESTVPPGRIILRGDSTVTYPLTHHPVNP